MRQETTPSALSSIKRSNLAVWGSDCTVCSGYAENPCAGILIGHGPDFAWTTTSGQTDMLDTYVAVVKPDSSASWFKGAWKPTEQRTETIVGLTSPASGAGDISNTLQSFANGALPAPPQLPPSCAETGATVGVAVARCTVTRVLHPDAYHTPYTYQGRVAMVVFGYSPRSVACPDRSGTNCRLAYLKRRAWSEREAGTFEGFVNYERLDSLAQHDGVTKLQEFTKLTSNIVSSHNLVYADSAGNIGYWLGGSYPLRPAGIVSQLPLNADGSEEWGNGTSMYLPFKNQPHVVNPAQGWVASWNNKPSNQSGFAAFDTGDSTRWGLQHHVEAIEDYLSGTGKLDFNGVARAGYRAAFNDTRVKWVMPILRRALSNPTLISACSSNPSSCPNLCPRLAEVNTALGAWFAGDSISGGAERTWFQGIPTPWWDQSSGWRYDSGAQALWDSWWNVGMELVFDHWFTGTPADYPGPSGDSMENGEDPFFIHALLGQSGAKLLGTLAPRMNYLSATGVFPATQQAFDAEVAGWAAKSMNDTLGWLANPSGGRPSYVSAGRNLPDPTCCTSGAISGWRENMVAAGDMNCFSDFGVYSAPCMPWEDKGTYAQVVEVRRTTTTAAATALGSPLQQTAPGVGLVTAASGAAFAVMVASRRRMRRRYGF